MSTCPHCDEAHDADATRCPHTGASLDDDVTEMMDRSSLDELASLVGVTLDHKYEVIELLGFGAVGRVYRARQRALGRDVAVKVLRHSFSDAPRVRDRFLREARAVGCVEHPNVVQIYDAGVTEEGLPYLVMELVQGEPLSERIEREGRLPLFEALGIASQVLSGLERAHSAGVIHRDVKPDNILVSDRDHVTLVDFGVAHLDTNESQLTQRGEVLGTPAYLSPEQALGTRVDAKADAWAASVLLYETVTGRRPFEGKQFMEILTAVMASDPLPPSAHEPDLPIELDALVLAGLAKDPDERADVTTLLLRAQQLLRRLQSLELRDTRMAPRRLGSLDVTQAAPSDSDGES